MEFNHIFLHSFPKNTVLDQGVNNIGNRRYDSYLNQSSRPSIGEITITPCS